MHSWKSFSALNNDVVNVAGKGPKSFTVTSQRQRVGMFDRTWFDARQVVPGWNVRTMPATSSNTRRRSHETDANTEIGTGNAAIRKRETKKAKRETRNGHWPRSSSSSSSSSLRRRDHFENSLVCYF